MSQEQPPYLSYLLRLWPADADGETVWRASLESGLMDQHLGFASLDELFDFLRQCTEVFESNEGEEG
jgi:hypothetical protein